MSVPALRYAPGLDGVRALAVLAVFTYHLGTDQLVGGFIGVDVFFVLSGYLITSLLMVEVTRTTTVCLRGFYERRARRLLPALVAVLLTMGAIGAVWLPEQAARLRGDTLAALGYLTNWWLIHEQTSYFGVGERPPLLLHLWSLAVEEQFYLVWPLLLIALVRWRSGKGLTVILIAGIAASAVAAGLLYDPWADPSRVYYGTDTRAAAPLVGALLAVHVRPWRPGSRHHRPLGAGWWDLLGVAGLAGLGIAAWMVTERDPLLYRGGFLVVALLSAAVVASAGRSDSRFGRALGTQPLRWLGERSYAIYLWHWPVCVLTRPELDVDLTGWANTALRLAVTLALAEVSYRLVERPVRVGPLFRLPGRPGPRYATVSVVSLVIVSTAIVGWQLTATADAHRVAAPGGVPIGTDPLPTFGPIPAGPSDPASKPGSAGPSGPASRRATPVRVAIFGDSQGRSLYSARPGGIGAYLDLSDQSIPACGILRGRVTSRSGERFDLTSSCPNWLNKWRDDAKGVKPDVALVVIGAYDVFDLRTGQTTLTFGTPEWDANFLATLRTGLDAIRESGAQIALAELPCYRPRKTNPRPPGWWPERGDDNRTRHVNQLLRQAADGIHIFTVQPAPAFCTDPAIGDDTKHRYDGVHYLGLGAAVYFDAIVPQLLAIPP
jgi:peptidoglycan/LPS O-acetylase OafA/YrhL